MLFAGYHLTGCPVNPGIHVFLPGEQKLILGRPAGQWNFWLMYLCLCCRVTATSDWTIMCWCWLPDMLTNKPPPPSKKGPKIIHCNILHHRICELNELTIGLYTFHRQLTCMVIPYNLHAASEQHKCMCNIRYIQKTNPDTLQTELMCLLIKMFKIKEKYPKFDFTVPATPPSPIVDMPIKTMYCL